MTAKSKEPKIVFVPEYFKSIKATVDRAETSTNKCKTIIIMRR